MLACALSFITNLDSGTGHTLIVQGFNHSSPPDTILATHEQLRQPRFPLRDFDVIFLAAVAIQVNDNQAIDVAIEAWLKGHPQRQIRLFVVIPPLLHAGDKTQLVCAQHEDVWMQPKAAGGAYQPAEEVITKPQTELVMIAPEKQWTTDLDANQTAALLEADSMPRVATGEAAPAKAQNFHPLDVVEVEDVLLHATEGVAVMEEASHVVIVSEDRNSFVHRSKVLMEHLVLVRLR